MLLIAYKSPNGFSSFQALHEVPQDCRLDPLIQYLHLDSIDSKGTYTFRRDVNNRMAEAGIEVFERALNMGHTPDVNTMCYDSPRKSRLEILEKALNRGARNVVTPW